MTEIYDVIVIGAGLSGLTAASLLAKRGLKVAVFDKGYNPGGSCGTFKRHNVTFDQGAAMLYGFGEKGFNPHRFVFNCLEEPIDVLKHDVLYCVNFKGQRIKFWADLDQFVIELSRVFPGETANIQRFYHDLYRIYHDVMIETPILSSPDEADRRSSLQGLLRHPISYARFLSMMNRSAESLLRRYFRDPEIFKFFDKLTSTYCYTTVAETPAVLAAIMFVDNHVGGSYYPAGSTVFLPGKLEKVIEANGGDCYYQQEVTRILFADGQPNGVELRDGSHFYARDIVYSGTVWRLYEEILPAAEVSEERRQWAHNLVPTYPSVVLYAHVAKSVIPADTQAIEMLVGNPDKLDESEVTAYILSIDDRTLCDDDSQVVVAIGPTFVHWSPASQPAYQQQKEQEKQRLIAVLELRFPGFAGAIRYAEVATPRTIERFAHKNGGAVAGPKQILGQHMLRRLHIQSEWPSLFYCGESTVMGTGTPAVTVSGLSAANAILRKTGRQPFVYQPDRPNLSAKSPSPLPRPCFMRIFPSQRSRSCWLPAAASSVSTPPAWKAWTSISGASCAASVSATGSVPAAWPIAARHQSIWIPR